MIYTGYVYVDRTDRFRVWVRELDLWVYPMESLDQVAVVVPACAGMHVRDLLAAGKQPPGVAVLGGDDGATCWDGYVGHLSVPIDCDEGGSNGDTIFL